jgi:hypothetical protein
MANDYAAENAQRRGGNFRHLPLDFDDGDQHLSRVAADSMSPDRIFERVWTLMLLDRVSERLQSEHEAAEELDRFEALKQALTPAVQESTYDVISKLEVTPTSARQVASPLRKRYRELRRLEISRTLEDIEDEIGMMFTSLA